MSAEPVRPHPLRSLLLLCGLAALIALLWALARHSGFRWQQVSAQLAAVSWLYVALGLLIIYACFWLRAWRWAVLLSPIRPVRALDVLPAQLIGFAAIALFGRVADLARPYLIARRTTTPVTTQLAIYSLERAFDLAAAATLFSATLALAPASMPHHALFARAGALSLLATLLLAAVALALRLRGDRIADLTQRLLAPLSPRLAELAHARLLDLQHGFRALTTLGEFAAAAALSLAMLAGIALTYLASARAFRASPILAELPFTAAMLLLASGIGGGLLQLPVLGWFTQIAIFAATLHALLGVPLDTATAAAALIFAVTNLSVLPAGLLTAHLQGIQLRQLTTTAEASSAEPAP